MVPERQDRLLGACFNRWACVEDGLSSRFYGKKELAHSEHICFHIAMTVTSLPPPKERGVKTGRRVNPAIDGPRDKTVCFMLSDGEKLSVDRLAFCMNITRSGILANVVATFVAAAGGLKQGREAETQLLSYLAECRKAVKKRGELAAKVVVPTAEGVK